ncbi:MAG TPA: endolytic transglycosylase MltG [Pseudonocardiaceae bacterium]|nr:endolytic transglycosylase MltG [Pseudonocardiaceae bacterium]
MNSDLDLYDELADDDYEDYGPPPRRHRKRWLIILVAVVVVIAGLGFGAAQELGYGFYSDYSGDGSGDVLFQVNSGDTVRDMAANMQQAGIVASANAFVKQARHSSKVAAVQPGYYILEEKMSAASAVAKLVKSSSRVGELQVQPGWQLDDTTATSGKVSNGILWHIAHATCATLNGKSTCLSVQDLRDAIQNNDPAALGVPTWAVSALSNVDPKHRLEGLILPGIYQLKPGETAVQTIKRLLGQSDAALQQAGLPSSTQQSSGFSTYQILTMASIIERESGTQADMPKIARVLYNRLALPMNLQLDSTVDYALDRPMIATSPSERPGAGPYDTYNNPGLPPTPISSPSTAAIYAAINPTQGPWLFFVVCQKNLSSCFATTFAEHQANVQIAHNNGVF